MTGRAPAIELAGVVKDYGRTRALAGIDLTVERGQIFGFLGPNGAGKTTTIRILLDLIRPTAGTARVLGFDSVRESLEVRRRCGYLPGELRLWDSMRAHEFLDFIDSFRPEKRDVRYRAELCERLGLDVSRRIRALSKGNKQKLGLVQALMHRPELLILDEPTSGLDPLVQEQVAQLLEEAVADARTVFFSSHVLPEVERLSHAVAIIRAGKIVAVEDIARLKGRAVHVIEVTFAEAPPARAFELPGVRELHRDGATVHLQARDGIDALLKAIARYRVVDLRTEQPSLEDVFLAYYAGGEAAAEGDQRPEVGVRRVG
ncbi:MAG TPA: ABC transporter ATP-binding protein [Dehalococcoidia bacterium]|nr:ABC transporter ATP-binding protein [Dehalococcoidia bacterium]